MLQLAHLFTAASFGIKATDIGIGGGPSDIFALMATITKILMILIGMLSVVMIVVGGLQITLAAGNSDRFKQGRETVLYSAVGLGIAISAYAIVTFLAGGV